jgi:hypothetical protein
MSQIEGMDRSGLAVTSELVYIQVEWLDCTRLVAALQQYGRKMLPEFIYKTEFYTTDAYIKLMIHL